MDLPPFLLDQFMATYEFASPAIRYNLAASAGPVWTFGELMALGGDAKRELDELRISYIPAQGTQRLRERIADFHDVDPDWVVVTTGASEALSVLYALASEPGASIVLPHPAFPAMPVMARAWNLGVTRYELNRKDGFAQTADLVLSAVDARTRLVLINSPHNPTGSVMPPEEIGKLAASLAERRIPLLVDEVYHPLYFGAQAPSATRFPNTIVVGDASKALSLSGLRVGWLIDRDAARRERLINLRSYFTISGSPITEAIATHALTHRGAIFARMESVARANLSLLEQFMQAHRSSIGWARPLGGPVAFPWWLDGRDARPTCEVLAREGVLTAPGECFDASDHFRLAFGGQASGFQDALAIASRVFRGSRPRLIRL